MFVVLGVLVMVSLIMSLMVVVGPFFVDTRPKKEIAISRPVMSGIIYFVLSVLAGVDLYADIKLAWPYWSWTVSLWLLIPLHLGLSIKKVAIDELAVVTFLDRPIEELEKSGPTWVPWLLYQIKTVPRRMQELEIPAPSAKIWRGERDNIPKGHQPALRVTHASKDDETFFQELQEFSNPGTNIEKVIREHKKGLEDDILFTKRLTTEVEVFIRWRPVQAGLFLQHYGDIDEVNAQIKDTAIGTVFGNLTRLTVGSAFMLIDPLNRQLRAEINHSLIAQAKTIDGQRIKFVEMTEEEKEKLVGSLGVKLLETTIKVINLDHDLNKSISNVLQENYNKKSTVVKAEAERTRLEQEGQGQAEAQKLALLAEADGHRAYLLAEAEGKKALAKVIAGKGGMEAAAYDALKAGLEKSQHTIIPAGDGMGSLVGMAATLQETLEQNKKKREENEI